MNYLMKSILLLFILKNSILAVTLDEAKIKADEKGGDSLSFDECKIIGSKFSNFDANGKPHADGGFHCAYISKSYGDKKQAKINSEKAKIDLEKKKEYENQKIKFAEFDKIKNEGRVYATLVLDTTESYNKDSLDILKKNNYKIAGLKLSYEINKLNNIEKITLKSPIETALGTYLSLLSGQKTESAWSLDKIKMYLKNIEDKYKKVDFKSNIQEFDLNLVRNLILKYHNQREKPSQADYNIDYNNAEAIKNLEEIYIFENKGDQILVTIRTCIKGINNSNPELLFNEIYQDSITIEYISKTVIEKVKEKDNEALRKFNNSKEQEKKEMNKL